MMKIRGMKLYFAISSILIIFNVLDVLSTEYIIHHSVVGGSEANSIVADLHETWIIWPFRLGIILIICVMLVLSRMNQSEFDKLLSAKTFDVAFGKAKNIDRITSFKATLFSLAAIVSINRFVAALSNTSGEIFGISIPIIVENVSRSGSNLYTLSVLLSTFVSILIFLAFWHIIKLYNPS